MSHLIRLNDLVIVGVIGTALWSASAAADPLAIVNGNFEANAADDINPPLGWVDSSSAPAFWTGDMSEPGGMPASAPPNSGSYFLTATWNSTSIASSSPATGVLKQAISLSSFATGIDSGNAQLSVNFLWAGGDVADTFTVGLSYYASTNGTGTALGSGHQVAINPSTSTTGWRTGNVGGAVPTSARSVTITITTNRASGTATNIQWDDFTGDLTVVTPLPPPTNGPRHMESLNRGVVVVRSSSSQAFVGWRLLGTEAATTGFNVYRASNGGNAVKLNSAPLAAGTHYVDSAANLGVTNVYHVRPVVGGVEGVASETFTLPANAPVQQYLSVPLQIPAGGTTPDGVAYTYSANDASVGDLDGDGAYEIVLKWTPSNAKDNSSSGYTGNQILDAYKLDGTRLWRIDLGKNIRAGEHYTQFMVYDLDSDGKAEVAMKTADGTKDGAGVVIGSATADYRNSGGYILTGPEYLTVFNGESGAAMATVPFEPARGSVADWGDTYGNRVDRFLAAVAYLDGVRPSLVMTRGYYDKSMLVAYDWRNGSLTKRWLFDSKASGNSAYSSQGNHNLSIADVDGDGGDDIIFGGCTINDNGTGLYSTGLGHGDAMHVSDLVPSRSGLEVFKVQEDPGALYGAAMWDAKTGQILWGLAGGGDVGRGVALDIDSRFPGFESWTSSHGSIYDATGTAIFTKPSNMFINFGVWWDGDLSREIMDSATISEWSESTNGRANFDLDPSLSGVQQYAPGCSSNNSTKANPCLTADLFGDWREEAIWRLSDNSELRIFTTIIPTSTRVYTLMHDPVYRLGVAWQNVGYNQPPHTGFFLGNGMSTPPTPNIQIVGSSSGANAAPTVATAASASPIVVTGTTTSLSVLGADDGGESALTYTWSASGPAAVSYSANGANASKNATATFTRAGSYTFTATIRDGGGLTATSSVNVTVNQTLTSLDVTPAAASVAANATQQFTATARDQFSQPMSSQPSVSWSVVTGGGTISTAGLYTAPSTAGSATVQGSSGSLSDTSSVTINVVQGPAAPTNLTASNASQRRAKLSWRDNASNETGFRIWSSRDGVTWTQMATVGAANGTGRTVTYTSTSLATGTWHFKVTAYNANGDSADSNTATLEI